MNSRTLMIGLSMSIGLAANSVHATEPTNLGFEDGLTGWTFAGNVEAGQAGGNNFVILREPGAGGRSRLSQDFDLPADPRFLFFRYGLSSARDAPPPALLLLSTVLPLSPPPAACPPPRPRRLHESHTSHASHTSHPSTGARPPALPITGHPPPATPKVLPRSPALLSPLYRSTALAAAGGARVR